MSKACLEKLTLPWLLWNTPVLYHVHKGPGFIPSLSQFRSTLNIMVPCMLQSSDIPSGLAPKTLYESYFFPRKQHAINITISMIWSLELVGWVFCYTQTSVYIKLHFKNLHCVRDYKNHTSMLTGWWASGILVFSFLNMFFLWVPSLTLQPFM